MESCRTKLGQYKWFHILTFAQNRTYFMTISFIFIVIKQRLFHSELTLTEEHLVKPWRQYSSALMVIYSITVQLFHFMLKQEGVEMSLCLLHTPLVVEQIILGCNRCYMYLPAFLGMKLLKYRRLCVTQY